MPNMDPSSQSASASRQNPSNSSKQGADLSNETALTLKPHPLYDIEQILVQVFSNLKLKHLKLASQVCSTWLPTVQKVMAKKSRLSFTSEQCQEFLNEHSWDHSVDGRCGFNRSMRIIKSISLALDMNHYLPTNVQVDEEVANEYENGTGDISWTLVEELLKFLKQNNVAITDLKLVVCPCDLERVWTLLCVLSSQLERVDIGLRCQSIYLHFDHAFRNFRRLEDAVVGNMPLPPTLDRNEKPSFFSQLKHISYTSEVRGAFTRMTNPGLARVFMNIMTHSSLIESIIYNKSFQDMLIVMDAVDASGQKELVNWQNLRNLDVGELSLDGFNILAAISPSLKLKNLSFILELGIRVQAMYDFISSQTTLEKLQMDFDKLPVVPDYMPFAKKLDNLKELTLIKYYGSLNFVAALPNLETFNLLESNLSIAFHDEEYSEIHQSSLKCIKIEECVRRGHLAASPQFYKNFVKFFHNLEKLNMDNLFNDGVAIIISGLPDLRELILVGFFTDDVFTPNHIRNEDGEIDALGGLRHALISDLAHLSKLVIDSVHITDEGVRHGLMICANLKSLTIITCPMITDVSLEMLSRKPGLMELKIINCHQLSPEAIAVATALWGNERKLVIKMPR